MKINIVDHPMIQHKLTLMRRKETSTRTFRELVNEVAMLLGYEVTRDLELTMETIDTPLETMESPVIQGKKLCFISILRAGNGLLDGLLQLLPSARVGHVGLYRDPETLTAVEYYYKVPADIGQAVFMLAAHFYDNRSALTDRGKALPYGVAALLKRHQPVRLLGGGV